MENIIKPLSSARMITSLFDSLAHSCFFHVYFVLFCLCNLGVILRLPAAHSHSAN